MLAEGLCLEAFMIAELLYEVCISIAHNKINVANQYNHISSFWHNPRRETTSYYLIRGKSDYASSSVGYILSGKILFIYICKLILYDI